MNEEPPIYLQRTFFSYGSDELTGSYGDWTWTAEGMTWAKQQSNLRPPIGSVYSLTLKRTEKYWEFPQERFVEYGPEDEWWARKYGFGQEIEVQVEQHSKAILKDCSIDPPHNNQLTQRLTFVPITYDDYQQAVFDACAETVKIMQEHL